MRDLAEHEIEAALSFISPDDRDTWWKMAMAIKSELGDGGFDIWDAWSRTGADYDERAARHTWKSCKIGGGVTIASLVWEAQQLGFKLDASAQQLDEQQAEERAKLRAEAKRKAAAEERKAQAAAAHEANELWEAATPASVHPYLSRKGVKSHGLRVGTWPLRNKEGEIFGYSENCLLIPARNERGQITTLQGVFATLPRGFTGDKIYLRDGKKSGSWFAMGAIGEGGKIAITEGYATGATIRELTGWCVLVCFDRTNLETVAKSVRETTPGVEIVICADNDQFTKDNPGLRDAKKAANAIAAKVLVPQFANLEGEPTDFNDLHQREGAEAVKACLGIGQPVEEVAAANDNNPFYPLGYDRGQYFYLVTGTQQLCNLSAAQHSKAHMMQLAPLSYWATEYPAKGASPVAWDMAADTLMRQCEARGVFSPDVIRGRGAWLDEGRAVFHFGSHLWVDGKLMGVTAIRSRYVYEMDIKLNPPGEVALTDPEGQMLVDVAKRFRWSKPASAALLAGFVALAPICGALRWRPHVWITGGAGCGKTTVLNEFVHQLLGGLDIFAQGNSTEAGIRQKLRSDALPVLFDESEQNNEREVGRVQNVLSLIRQASSESAAMTLKGTAGGDAMHFIVRSMFCLSSIQVGMKHQADLERLTVLALRPKREDTDAANNWASLKDELHLIQRDHEMPSRLFKRTLELLPITLENIKTFVEAASRKFGSVREGDQYGTLLAGCWSLMSSRLATSEEAAALIESFEWDEFRENLEVDESTKALGALLEAQVRIAGGVGLTIHEIIMAATGRPSAGSMMSQAEATAALGRYGMRVQGEELLLSNNSHALAELMPAPYNADWRGQILRVPGVRRHEKAVRFSGHVSKCLAVPLASIMDNAQDRSGPPF